MSAVRVVTETGIKLGQVLWRASSDACIAPADEHLADLLFELLKREEWTLALELGDFGRDIAKRSHRRPRNERSLKIIAINHAQAARWSGNTQACREIIDSFDWSGSANDFQLAVACLREEWDTAARLMVEIGSENAFLPIHSYVGWPIFREFRATPQFQKAFRSIFGVEFASEVKKASEQPKVAALPEYKPRKRRRKQMPVDPTRK